MQSRRAPDLLKPVLLLIGTCLLGGCEDTPGFKDIRFKSTADAPATPSIVQAYEDIADEMLKDSVDIISMDRTLHGIRQPLNTIPSQTAANNPASFDRYESLYFKVYKVEVVDQYKMPVSLNADDHLLVTPNDAVHEWANRLRPTGGVNKLQVVITDARLTPSPESQVGVQKLYNASLAIEMRICNRDGRVLSSVTSSTIQSANISEDNRKTALNDMLLKLIDSTNGQLESKMSKNFGNYIDRDKAV